MVCSPGHGCWCLPVLYYRCSTPLPSVVVCFHLVSRKQRARPPLAVYVQCLSGGTRAALCQPFNISILVRVLGHTIPVDNLAHRNDSCSYRNILQVFDAWRDHSMKGATLLPGQTGKNQNNYAYPRVKRRGGLFPFDVGASGVENDASGGDDDASGSNGGGDTHALLKRTRARRRREVGKDPCLPTRMILLATGNAYKTTFVQVSVVRCVWVWVSYARMQTRTHTHPPIHT